MGKLKIGKNSEKDVLWNLVTLCVAAEKQDHFLATV